MAYIGKCNLKGNGFWAYYISASQTSLLQNAEKANAYLASRNIVHFLRCVGFCFYIHFLCEADWVTIDPKYTSRWEVVEGAVASWLVRPTPERAVRVRTLAGDIVLCSWARHFTLTVPLSTQVYKWVPANCWGNLANCGEVTCDGLASRPGEVEIPLAASCYRNRDTLRQPWASLGSLAPRLHTSLGQTVSFLVGILRS